MTLKVYTRIQHLWFRIVFGWLTGRISKRIKYENDERRKNQLIWRLAINNYKAGNYEAASEMLHNVIEMVTAIQKSTLHKVDPNYPFQFHESKRPLTILYLKELIAQCNIELFLSTYKHQYLQVAYQNFQFIFDNLLAVQKSLVVNYLVDFGHLLEYYGAFEACLDIYGQIITNTHHVQTFSYNYFYAMYRAALIAHYFAAISSTSEDSKQKLINQCIEYITFLLEALPKNVTDYHILLLYSNIVELSNDQTVQLLRFDIEHQLFRICRKQRIACSHAPSLLGSLDKRKQDEDIKSLQSLQPSNSITSLAEGSIGSGSVQTHDEEVAILSQQEKAWLANPLAWFELGNHMRDKREFLLARICYERYIQKAHNLFPWVHIPLYFLIYEVDTGTVTSGNGTTGSPGKSKEKENKVTGKQDEKGNNKRSTSPSKENKVKDETKENKGGFFGNFSLAAAAAVTTGLTSKKPSDDTKSKTTNNNKDDDAMKGKNASSAGMLLKNKKLIKGNTQMTSQNEELFHIFSIEKCITIAKNYATFQNYFYAIKYLEMAIQQAYYRSDIRSLLVACSKEYAEQFTNEKQAIYRIVSLWKHRIWTKAFIMKLKLFTIHEYEQQLALDYKHYYAPEIRSSLSYYCKEKYRSLFLFEIASCMKIQRFIRKFLLKIRKYHVKVQEFVFQINTYTNQYQRWLSNIESSVLNFGYVPPGIGQYRKLRQDIKKLHGHRMFQSRQCKKHPILEIILKIQYEDLFKSRIHKNFQIYKLKSQLKARITVKRHAKYLIFMKDIIRIQCFIRQYLAKCTVIKQKTWMAKRLKSVLLLQRFWRKFKDILYSKRNNSEHRTKRRAILILKKLLGPLLKVVMHKRRKMKIQNLLSSRYRMNRGKLERGQTQRFYREHNAATTLQKFYRAIMANKWYRLARIVLSKRLLVKQSSTIHRNIQYMVQSYSCDYETPGILVKSPAYQRLLFMPTVFCAERNLVDIADLQMLGMILRNPYCNIQQMVFYHMRSLFASEYLPLGTSPAAAPATASASAALSPPGTTSLSPTANANHASFEGTSGKRGSLTRALSHSLLLSTVADQSNPMDYFFHSIVKCMSLHTIYLIGGEYSASMLQKFFNIIQVENPRIKHLYVENINQISPLNATTSSIFSSIGLYSSFLLKDYFNYTIPGVKILSLHGCSLRDEQAILISEGLAVNTSIEEVIVSLNFITDDGFLALFNGITKNVKSKIKKLDCKWNFIRNQFETRNVLCTYRNQNVARIMLEIDLSHNNLYSVHSIFEYYSVQKVTPQMILIFDDNIMDHLEDMGFQTGRRTASRFGRKSRGGSPTGSKPGTPGASLTSTFRTINLTTRALSRHNGNSSAMSSTWNSATGGSSKLSKTASVNPLSPESLIADPLAGLNFNSKPLPISKKDKAKKKLQLMKDLTIAKRYI